MISKIFNLTCADCGAEVNLKASNKETALEYARANGWAITRNRQTCYCPTCAPFRRNVGKTGLRRQIVQETLKAII